MKDFAFDSDNAVQRADLKSWRVGQREEHAAMTERDTVIGESAVDEKLQHR